jgi:ABC-2 type transport system permease protein
MYSLIDETLRSFSESFPEALLAIVGGGDMSTPEGFYQVETFGLMAPIAVMLVTIAVGARGLAGEEAHRTMGLLLANPIRRSTIVVQKALAMAVSALVVGVATASGVMLGSVLGGLGMSIGNIAATSLLVTLLGLVFGALALALSAATGRVKLAIYGTIAAALIFHMLNSFLPLSDRLATYAKLSPNYYYLTSDPLLNGMQWAHGALLASLAALLVGVAIVLFQRRDLRQTG